MQGMPPCTTNCEVLISFLRVFELTQIINPITHSINGRMSLVVLIASFLHKFIQKNLKSFITVKAHCSMTHLKQQKSYGLF